MCRCCRLLLLLLLLPACIRGDSAGDILRIVRGQPHRYLRDYRFNPATALLDRVVPIPPATLRWLRATDANPGYAPHTLSPAEKKLLGTVLAELPPLIRRVMRERLVAIYVLSNFMGAGMADFVPFAPQEGYSVLFLNRGIFTNSFAGWLNLREGSAFRSGRCRIRYSLGRDLPALQYILLHEGAHLADYAYRLTPVVEPDLDRILLALGKRSAPATTRPELSPFTAGVWDSISRPLPRYDFPERTRIRFYNLYGPAQLPADSLPRLARRLAATPFPSFYAALSWAENLAESLTFYHLTVKLKIPVTLQILDGKKTVFACRWADNRLAAGQRTFLDRFYE